MDATTGACQVLLNDARDPSISRDGMVLAYLRFDKAYYTFTVHPHFTARGISLGALP